MATFEDQTDNLAALLDELKVEKVAAVYGISGGGPIAYTFAVRHPDRCSVLLTECGISGNLVHHSADSLKSKSAEVASTSTIFARMPEILGPKMALTEMLKMSST